MLKKILEHQLSPVSSSNQIEITNEGIVLSIPSKTIKIDGNIVQVDIRELVRIIKYITQTIGEHKREGTVYAAYAIPALRKARCQAVSDLEKYFGITWKLNEKTNQSEFFKGR